MSKNKKEAEKRVVPVGDRVLVKPFEESELESKTASGIIIPETVEKDRPEQGEVIAVGEGRFQDGERVPMSIKEGDKVVFSKFGYDEVTIEGEEYYILKEDNILAVIK
ncbi:MAG: co-chaperone GroES [Candidatus Paceibacterota bacterium]